MRTATLTSIPSGETFLDTLLHPIHTAWVEEAHRLLEPALESDADFWTRWAAVRYISEDFQDQYSRERALLDELQPFLRPEVAGRLMRDGDRVFQLRLELDRVGRRRATAAEFAARTRDFLQQLRVWCTEIELAAAWITGDSVPAEGAELLAYVEADRLIRR
jgi:hypothetical protein